MLGISGENVTSIENVRSFVLALPSLGSSDADQTIGFSITPARTAITPMDLQSYASSFPMRLLGSLTVSYARGPATIEDVDFERSAYSVDTNAFLDEDDDVVVAYAKSFEQGACKDVLQAAQPDGPPRAPAPRPATPPGAAMPDAATPGPVSPGDETEGPARPHEAPEAEANAVRERAKACHDEVVEQVNSRWNRSQVSLSYGEAKIRIKDHSKPEESLGRTLAVSVIYGFGNSADGTRGFAVSANYRRTEKEPVLDTLAAAQTTFKTSSLLVGRLIGGSDSSRIFAEFSNAKSRDITASQRAFKRALGLDIRMFEGTWLNLRVGEQRTIDGTDTETGSLLAITYSPKALLSH